MSDFGFEDLETIHQIAKLLNDPKPQCLRCSEPLEITQNSYKCNNNDCKAVHRKETFHSIKNLQQKLEQIIQKFLNLSLLEKDEIEEYIVLTKTHLVIKKIDYIIEENNKCQKCHSGLENINGFLVCKTCDKKYLRDDISDLVRTIDELKQKINIIQNEKRIGKEITEETRRKVY